MNIADCLVKLNQRAPRVCVVGSINADLTVVVEHLPEGGETIAGSPLRVLPGGKSANQAAAASRLGAEVQLIGAVGNDLNAALLRTALDDAEVDITAVETVDSATGTAMIVVDSAAENFIVISAGANDFVDRQMVQRSAECIEKSGCLGLCLEVGDEAVLAAARIANAAGVPVVLNLSPIRQVDGELLELIDVLIVNEHELAAVLGPELTTNNANETHRWERVGQTLQRRYGIATAIVTLGSVGSVVLKAASHDWETLHSGSALAPQDIEVTRIPAMKTEVVDTTGCGDSYMGTVLASLSAGYDVVVAARLASAVAAFAATRVGAQASYGTASQIVEFIQDSLAD